MVKFNKHHVTNGTVKARVHYSVDSRIDNRTCVTLYAKDYTNNLRKVIPDLYENKTDTMVDYFDTGSVVIFEGHPLYAAARERAEAVVAEVERKRVEAVRKRTEKMKAQLGSRYR